MEKKFPLRYIFLALLAVPVMVIASLLGAGAGKLVFIFSGSVTAGNFAAAVMYPIATLAGLWALCRYALRANLPAYRITVPRFEPVWCAAAVLMPGLVCGVYLLLPGHWAIPERQESVGNIIAVMILYVGIAAGIVEEAVFRGVLMTALERRWGRTAAVLIPSVLFGVLHILDNDLDAASAIQLLIAGTMVGVLFSLVTLETGSIWSSALIHGVWNSVILGVLHIGPEAYRWSLFSYVPESGSFWLTGGDFGVEASVVSVIVYALFAALALVRLRRKKQ